MFVKDLAVLSLAATLGLFAPLAAAESKLEVTPPCPSNNKTHISLSAVAEGNKIYFNNHCNDKMRIEYQDSDSSWNYGFIVNEGTKGSDKVDGEITGLDASPV